ncbi:protein SIEL isoform X3 [Amborella trichopoda]|uniref:protein SIEL isoform X3 n=1 Tax=Amborella trichopoda TaxID=13333 RepID=UPI0009C04D0B|nr:protein SIEL isoform X3 [Amborella trichopoda]|eukprot:XP_020526247.1 protein SIEL isoform X3 [Amborella trichopoda]
MGHTPSPIPSQEKKLRSWLLLHDCYRMEKALTAMITPAAAASSSKKRTATVAGHDNDDAQSNSQKKGGEERSLSLNKDSILTHFLSHHPATEALNDKQLWMMGALIRHISYCHNDPLHLQAILNLFSEYYSAQPLGGGEDAPPLIVSTAKTIIHLLSHKKRSNNGSSNYDDMRSRLKAQALSVLLLLTQGQSLPFEVLAQVEDAILALLSSSLATSVRVRALNLLAAMAVKRRMMKGSSDDDGCEFRILLAFCDDLYPSVRKAAFEGLMAVVGEESWELLSLRNNGHLALALLKDEDEIIRLYVVRMISSWKGMLGGNDEAYVGQLDEAFLQLCLLSRDISKEVRCEALLALGRMKLVSEDILLQSLTKKILEVKSGIVHQSWRRGLVSSAAGAFIHGLEDEFFEVRRAACVSLVRLSSLSRRFAHDALNLLMDMLNDDSMVVRLHTLQALSQMAVLDCLTVQEKHMHMFLGMLVDNNPSIRCETRKLLRKMKLPDLKVFKTSVQGLLMNLERYPEDEPDILSVIYYVGKSHKKLSIYFAKEFAQEIEPSCEGELKLDKPHVAALFVLIVTVPLSNERILEFPTKIFSYGLSLLGKISSLEDGIYQEVLSGCLKCMEHIVMCSVALDTVHAEDAGILHDISMDDKRENLLAETKVVKSEVQFQKTVLDLQHMVSIAKGIRDTRAFEPEEATRVVKHVLDTVVGTWPLIQARSLNKALKILRTCQEELQMTSCGSSESIIDVLVFASQYVEAVMLLAQIWTCLSASKLHAEGKHTVDISLGELDSILKRMRYCFLGLTREEELHLLELILLSYVLRLSSGGSFTHLTLSRLQETVSYVAQLHDGPSEVSHFMRELKLAFCQGSEKEQAVVSSCPFPVNKLLELFSLRPIPFSGIMKHIRADMHILDNDSENPIPFIPGLPVAITYQISLFNVSPNEGKGVWLQMVLGESVQHNFLDLCQFGGSDQLRYIAANIPFYQPPKAASFSMRASVMMESSSECLVNVTKDWAATGPKHELICLCAEVKVYLAMKTGCNR